MTLPALGAWLSTVEVSRIIKKLSKLASLTEWLLAAVFGPLATGWFGVLQRHVVLKGTTATTVARVAADQLFFAPAQLTLFLSSMAIMEGSDPVQKLKHSFVPTYKANLMVWPFVQGLNFTFVPPGAACAYSQRGQLGWVAILPWYHDFSTDNVLRLELLLEYPQQQLSEQSHLIEYNVLFCMGTVFDLNYHCLCCS
ncbi:hypothetical protein N7468_006207 [Penicillium chermesinum]|uniref:Uncharacterized protein n=1 Tax=Penicillium chermesinum TaxID=63820 RepID=A0A9W9NRS7_9EURO|nr:uncharacterized protein N7468_006207 [Penicillium chermesinum]KAJ5224982.1 hypothetical protein N7468_006207 [Penicillium chermesinum]